MGDDDAGISSPDDRDQHRRDDHHHPATSMTTAVLRTYPIARNPDQPPGASGDGAAA